MKPSIENIVAMIVQLSLNRHTDDPVRDIYTVLMDVTSETNKLFKRVRDQERERILGDIEWEPFNDR